MTRPMVVLAMLMAMFAGAVPAAAAGQEGVTATFEGRTIDLSTDWEGAGACLVWPEALPTPECFATEREMDRRIARLELSAAPPDQTMSGSNCSGYLRLYDGTSYTGTVLYLRTRLQWLNLSGYGFNNRTSSYKVGPCSSYFADLANGGGGWYPTYLTQAYDQAASMLSGWNNDVSSVYIT